MTTHRSGFVEVVAGNDPRSALTDFSLPLVDQDDQSMDIAKSAIGRIASHLLLVGRDIRESAMRRGQRLPEAWRRGLGRQKDPSARWDRGN